jgi:hypothetical protein
MNPLTYRDIIRTYARDVASAHADTDLAPRERRLTEVLLNLASNYGMAAVCYPPTDGTRDETVKSLSDIVWQARPLLQAVGPASADAFERAVSRSVEILRGV